jgi:hypothetical protein
MSVRIANGQLPLRILTTLATERHCDDKLTCMPCMLEAVDFPGCLLCLAIAKYNLALLSRYVWAWTGSNRGSSESDSEMTERVVEAIEARDPCELVSRRFFTKAIFLLLTFILRRRVTRRRISSRDRAGRCSSLFPWSWLWPCPSNRSCCRIFCIDRRLLNKLVKNL